MNTCAIVGINWGDEGKGRIVDLLTEQFNYVIRFQGGGNAGHTVINDRGSFALHLLPSGIFHDGVVNILGNGVALDPENLWKEIQEVRAKGISLTPENLKISTPDKNFDAMVNESNLRRGIKGAVGVFSMLTQVSETAVRFAGYVAARQKGMGINEAAYLSKELTTNFDRAGEVADSGWMSWFSFFRATLNGNIKFLKALKKMPVAYSIIAAAYVAMGMLNQFLNPDDPEDEVWAGDYTRESNFVIGKWRIPTAHFLRMFFAAGVNAAKWMQGEKSFGEATYNTANFASQELLPNYLNLFGNGTEWNSREGKVDFTWEGLLQGVMPSPISPIADVYFNRDFRGATINREPFVKSQEGTKDILLSKENTLPVYKWLTQAIYEGVGGNMNAKYQSDDPAWRSW